MNCDTAFDLMTDPNGTSSLALQTHLAGCARCQAMQETLSPALQWLADSERDVEAGGARLPISIKASSGGRAPVFATAEAIEIAQASAARLSQSGVLPLVRHRTLAIRLVRCAALVAVGWCLGMALVPGSRPMLLPRDNQECRRDEIGAERLVALSRVEIDALVATCAACHSPDRREGAMRIQRPLPIAFALPGFRYL